MREIRVKMSKIFQIYDESVHLKPPVLIRGCLDSLTTEEYE